MVGALRRLATEAVVMNANVTHVMYVGLATARTGASVATLTGRSAGVPAVAISHTSGGDRVGESLQNNRITRHHPGRVMSPEKAPQRRGAGGCGRRAAQGTSPAAAVRPKFLVLS